MTKTTIHEQLRVDTARWLSIDLKAMSPAQEVRLERAVVLRLEIDDLMAAKVANAGAPFDVRAYVAASESLEQLVGGTLGQQTNDQHDFADAKQELLTFLENRAEAIARRDERTRAAALEASKQTGVSRTPVSDGSTGATASPLREPPSPVPELLPEGQDPPSGRPPVTYVDAGVLDDHQPSPLRTSSLNNAAGQSRPPSPRPSSPVTAAFFGKTPGNTGLGNNPWRTRDWSPRRGF